MLPADFGRTEAEVTPAVLEESTIDTLEAAAVPPLPIL